MDLALILRGAPNDFFTYFAFIQQYMIGLYMELDMASQ